MEQFDMIVQLTYRTIRPHHLLALPKERPRVGVEISSQ